MSKTDPDELVKGCKEELVTYLKRGRINESQLGEALDFSGTSIGSFSRVKKVHFVLSDPVLKFVDMLPERVRRINKESSRSSIISHGKIEGKVDWGKTTKLRHSDYYGDSSVFACETASQEYDIPENLVLKKVLGIIYDVVTEEIEGRESTWKVETWGEEKMQDIKSIFDRNVHVNRIRNHHDIELRPRDLSAARKSRSPLYYNAYDLYDMYESLMSNNLEGEAEDILRETLVRPNRVSVLYELFAVFRVIEALQAQERYSSLSLQPIERASDEIAVMENEDYRVKVFHDETGNLSFHIPVDEIEDVEEENEYLRRYVEVLDEHEDLLDRFLDKGSEKSLYQGRPDIIVEILNSQEGVLEEVILGEVKYTDRELTFSDGLKQLLEYMKYAKPDGNVPVGEQEWDEDGFLDDAGCDVSGVLIADGVKAGGQDDIEEESKERDVKVVDTDGLMGGEMSLFGR